MKLLWIWAFCAMRTLCADQKPEHPRAREDVKKDIFSLPYYVEPLLLHKDRVSILEIGPAEGEEIASVFQKLDPTQRQKIYYDGVEFWKQKEPLAVTRLKKQNPGRVHYFPGQDIFDFIPRQKYDLVYARAVPLGWGKRGGELLKQLTPFLNPGAHIVVLLCEDWYEGPLEHRSQEAIRNSVNALKPSFLELGFSLLKVEFNYPVEIQEERDKRASFLSQQETLEKACAHYLVESFLGNHKGLEHLTQFLEIPNQVLQKLQKREEVYRNSANRLRSLRSFSLENPNPKRRYFDSLLVEQLKMCPPKKSSRIQIKALEKSLDTPWKNLSGTERRAVFDKIFGEDFSSLRVIIKKIK